MKFTKGFTLIELLVVIAIIGILSSVVLASLTSARAKGTDAAIQSNLANMRAQGELFYGNQSPNSYGSSTITLGSTIGSTTAACLAANSLFVASSSDSLRNLLAAAKAASVDVQCSYSAKGAANVIDAWAMAAKQSNGSYWCVDSTGASKQGGLNGTVSATCL
jgi:prepilin-type N-terminal cleavage/methylation domain-containing protein